MYVFRKCLLGGKDVPCKDLFTRVPTDSGKSSCVPSLKMSTYSGMCCALNAKTSLRNSTYSQLVAEMQENKEKKQVPVSVGKRDGLTLLLDLHSNRATLGTVARSSDAFNIFIGRVFKTIRKPNFSTKSQPVRSGPWKWSGLETSGQRVLGGQKGF